MPKLKIYTPGPRHFVTNEIAQALGLGKYRSQADVYVAAYTKAEAFQFLTELHLAPSSIHDSEFRVAMGRPVDALIAADALPKAGAVAATRSIGMNGPAVWVDETGCLQFGKFVRGEFVSDPDLIAGGGLTASPITEAELAADVPDDPSSLTRPTDPSYPDEPEMLLARLNSSSRRIPQIEAELARARAERNELCLRAVELGLVDAAAVELDVTPARVYQLKDKALRAKADQGEFLPGLLVQIEELDRYPSRYPLATVVEGPVGRTVPDGDTAGWVWVSDQGNESVFPVRKHRVHVAVPSCSICPPEDAPYGLTKAQLGVHQACRHGGRS
jgi:hypothetical protein